MGFFSGLRQDLSQAVSDLMSNESTRDSVQEYEEPEKENTGNPADSWQEPKSGFWDENREEPFIGQGSYFATVLDEAEPELAAEGTASEGVFLDELLPEESDLDEILIGEPEPEKPAAEEMLFGELPTGEMQFEETATGEAQSAEPLAGEMQAAELPAEEERTEEPFIKEVPFAGPATEEVRAEEPAAVEMRFAGPITEEVRTDEAVTVDIQPGGVTSETQPIDLAAARVRSEEPAAGEMQAEEDTTPEPMSLAENLQAKNLPMDLADRESAAGETVSETNPVRQDYLNDKEIFHISQEKEEEIGSMNMETFGFEGENVMEEMVMPEQTAVAESTEPEAAAEPQETRRVPVDETAMITAGMTITGDISSEGSMEVMGTIVGNIDIFGKLNVTGAIQGNSKAAEVYCEGAKITGEIVSEGSVKVGQSTVIIGNIAASSAVIAGAVKGDIDVHGPVVLDTTAIVMGNIKFKSVQINNGAVIEGMCSQCYSDVNPSSFFEDFTVKMKSGNNEQ